MQISQADWNKYRKKQASLCEEAADKMVEWLESKGGYININTNEIVSYAYALSTKYGEGTASLAAQMYDDIARVSKKELPSAEVAQTASLGEIKRAVNAVTENVTTDKNVASVVSKSVKQAGADTMLKNAIRDGAQFAWVPGGDGCAYCLMIASKGWQNASKSVLSGNHAEHIHPNCMCEFVIRFDKDSGVKGYDPTEYKKVFEDAEGKTSSEKLNSIRRIQYQENKDKINAQKRANYAEKNPKNRNINAEQNRRIVLSKDSIEDTTPKRSLIIRKDENRKEEVYISENASIKPKELSNIISDIKESINGFGGNQENIPRIVIVSKDENNQSIAAYNCINNTMYVIPEAGNRTKIIEFQEGMAEGDNPKSTAYHETWHWIQAERYKEAHGNITTDNLEEYNKWRVEKAKNHLDKSGVSSENVGKISHKAELDYLYGKYDEVEAEYQVVKKLRGNKNESDNTEINI